MTSTPPHPRSLAGLALSAILLVASTLRADPHDAPPGGDPAADRPLRVQLDLPAPLEVPEPSPAVARLLDQGYLSDEERAEIRVRHGVWTAEDLEDISRRARAAVIRGAWNDASLRDERAPAIERAHAALERGEPESALELLGDQASMRARRLRALANLALGRVPPALAELDAVAEGFVGAGPEQADEVAEGVRALVVRLRLRGPEGDVSGDYRALMGLLARAREERDKLSWMVRLAEGELLFSKGNYEEAGESLGELLALNGQSAEGWSLLGRTAVDSFDLERAEAIAARLHRLAMDDPSGDELEPASPAGGVIAALARLRERDAEGAVQALAPLMEKFPSHREMLAVRAAVAGVAYDFAGADGWLARLEAASPGAPSGYLEVGKACSFARQYEEAARYLEQAQARAPKDPEPAIALGLLEMQSGRLDRARTALEHAATLDRFNTQAANSLTLLRELAGFSIVESEHFTVRFAPGEDEILAREMLPALERIHARVTGNGPGGIDHVPAGRTVIELMPNHRWFSVRITGMPRLHTIAAATGPVIAMEAPRLGPGHLVGPYDWQRVVQHEFTHTVTLSRTKNRLPHWFTEAGAVYLEDRPRDERTARLIARAWREDELFDLDTINIMFVRPRRATDRSLAYAQGHWMYEFMIERFGPRAPLELMDLYAAGKGEEEAFEQVLGLSRARFLDEFKAWAGDQLRAWGALPPKGTPTLADLLGEGHDEESPEDGAPEMPTIERLEELRSQHPGHPQVLSALAHARAARAGDSLSPEDVSLLEELARARPFESLPHKALARWYLRAGSPDPSMAIEHLAWLDVREQHSPSFAVELARRYAATGDLTRAMESSERGVGIAPYDATIREFAATIALRAGDLAAAERHIEALGRLEPGNERHRQRLEAIRAKRRAG